MRTCVVWALLSSLALGCKGKEDAALSAPAADASAAQVASAFALAAQALADAQNNVGKAGSGATAAGTSAAPTTASAAPSASAAVVDSGFTPAVANELGRLGFSTAAAELTALGKDRGVLLSALTRLTGHPTALSAIFDNDKVVSAFNKRPDMQEACRDPEKLKPLLSYVLSSAPARAWVNDPASIKAFSDSKLGSKLRACPAFKELAAQPKALALLTAGNANATAVTGHPNFRAELQRLKIQQEPAGAKFVRKGR